MKSLFIAAIFLGSMAAPSFAGECPALIQKAEEAIKAATLNDEMMNNVMVHIVLGKSQHDEGKHDESIANIKEALQLLGV